MDATEGSVVVVDAPGDAAHTARHLETTLSVSCRTTADPSDALSVLGDQQVDCVVAELAIRTGDETETVRETAGNASDFFDDVRRYDPTLPVIVYTDVPVDEGVEGPLLPGVTALVGKDETGAAEELTDWVDRSVTARRDVSGRPSDQGADSDRRARRERLGGIAHDLRNPLGAANVYLDTVREDCDGPAVDGLAATHERLGELVADLDALASAGRRMTDPDDVAIDVAARAAWTTVDTGDACLHVETSATVRGHRRRVRRLLENLFANAVTHGGGDVAVVVGELVEEGGDGFFVADDGPGIPPERRDSVFERGYTTTDEGTGYGLAIVAELAEAHGWDVVVGKSEGGGARFEVRTA